LQLSVSKLQLPALPTFLTYDAAEYNPHENLTYTVCKNTQNNIKYTDYTPKNLSICQTLHVGLSPCCFVSTSKPWCIPRLQRILPPKMPFFVRQIA